MDLPVCNVTSDECNTLQIPACRVLQQLPTISADTVAVNAQVDVNAEDTQVEMWLRAKTDIGRVADGRRAALCSLRVLLLITAWAHRAGRLHCAGAHIPM
jgi:hypothetical protein